MPLPLATVLFLAAHCAPNVAPQTLLAVAQVESGFDPFAIGVNGPSPYRLRPRSAAEAIRWADALLEKGQSIDLGLAQINSRTLNTLGLKVRDAFLPCSNLNAAGLVLQRSYRPLTQDAVSQQLALRVALSRYNTGDSRRGFANGYVARVEAAAGITAPKAFPSRLTRWPDPASLTQPSWFLTPAPAIPAARPAGSDQGEAQ